MRRYSTNVTVIQQTTHNMQNIEQVKDYFYPLPTVRRFLPQERRMDYRNDWLKNRMLKFYSKAELDQVFTNRRSDGSDTGVINYFLKADQPYHTIPIDDDVEKAIAWTTENFRPNRILHPVSYPDLRYYPRTLSVSAEAPWTNNNFTFKPTGRNVDAESELPKLSEAEGELEGTQHTTPFEYLRHKQSIGLAPNSKLTYHNLYNQVFFYNRQRMHEIGIGAKQFWDGLKPKPYYWLNLHMRTHVVAADQPDKVRAVFGAPKLLLDAELLFIWPLQATYLNTGAGRMLWGREIIRGGWRKLFSEMHVDGPPKTIISTDWSEFDNRLLHQLIRIVHRIWRSYFDFSRYESTSFYPESSPKNKHKLDKIWKWMTESILNTPILLPDGKLYTWKFNGFGSGFQQTQLLDSFCNSIMLLTCLSALGVNINSPRFWARFQGDDSITAFQERMFQIYGKHFLNMLSKAAVYYFNAKLNTDKTDISDRTTNVSVLSYFNSMGLPYRTDEDLLRHLYFPERHQDLSQLAASALGMAYANCGNSKRFHQLCEYIWTKLTIEKQFKPNFRSIDWMVRSNIFPSLEEVITKPFPTLEHIGSLVFSHKPRTESQQSRQWPTKSRPKGRFFFCNNV